MSYYFLYITIILLITTIFIRVTYYFNKASRVFKKVPRIVNTKVILCTCGKHHNPIEKLKNICLDCRKHIYSELPVFYSPVERAWVYGTHADALLVDIDHFRNRTVTTTHNEQIHACNRCGKQEILIYTKILNAKYCVKCINLIEKERPKQNY